MKNFSRNLLKSILGSLSKKTIAKHHAEVIVVVGWTGSSAVREMIYHILRDSFNVRRNVTDVWWDLSVPLGILGYEDKKRNPVQWLVVIVKAYISLFIKPKYHHKIIINLDTSVEDTARFWSKYIKPNIVVILKEKPESKVLKMLFDKEGSEKYLFVHNPYLFKGLMNKQVREFIYSRKGDLSYKRVKKTLLMEYKKERVSINIPSGYPFIWELIPAAFSVGLLQGIEVKDLVERISHFEMHPKQVQKAIDKLKSFVISDE